MIHPLLQTVLLTVLVPAALAGTFVFAASWVPPGRWRSGMVASGLAVAWCAGWWLAVRSPRYPPAQAADWQFFAVALAGVLAFLAPLREAPRAWRWASALLFFTACFAVLLQRVLVGLWPGPGAVLWPLGLAALALINAGGVERVGYSVQAAWTFFALVVFATLVSALLALSGAASLGHGMGLLASACGAAWLVSCGLRRQVEFGPAALVVTVIGGGLLAQGLFFAGLRPQAALAVGLAWPAASGVAWLLRHRSGVFRAGAATAVVAACGGAALWLVSR